MYKYQLARVMNRVLKDLQSLGEELVSIPDGLYGLYYVAQSSWATYTQRVHSLVTESIVPLPSQA